MHDLAPELRTLPLPASEEPARQQALRLETRELFSVHRELLVVMYVAVAMVIAGVGGLIKANLDHIGPTALLAGLLAGSALCHALALRVRAIGRERSLGEDYVLLLGALLFSAAVGYAEARFDLFGQGWSRHLLWLSLWHAAVAYYLRSRLVLSVALAAFAAWLGVEASLGSLLRPRHELLGLGPRSLLCALVFWSCGWLHQRMRLDAASFRDVYRQFAANLAFWGALALCGQSGTRWVGAVILVVLALGIGRLGLKERRQSFLLYAVGYGTVGLLWLQGMWIEDRVVSSWLGLFIVAAAMTLLLRLRARLRESGT